jgi:PTS system N-acetylglucosamine-specific IIC component
MMKWLQKLGKSLMLPVAVLPVCGILMGIGYALCPATMQGGEISGVANLVGFFLVKAGGALIDNMALLFAVGVAVGLANDHDGTASLAGLVSWLVITTLLSTGTVGTMFPNLIANEVNSIAFSKIQNAFIGIGAGIIGSSCYNRFKTQKLPDFLAFFSGKRFVAIATAIASIIASAVLLLVWPLIFSGLVALGQGIVKMGYFGAGLYAFLNRLLIPFGLHHALNNVFWFDTIGLGDLSHFWAGDVTGVNGVNWDLGIYMSGFFAPMMFGIPGAALAIYRNAKPSQKKAVASLMISAAVCSFICGVTEPFEFSFMFLAFPLYIVYSLLYLLFTVITCIVGFRGGFSFSAGLTDLIFSSSLPAAAKTWLIIPLGICAFIVFYFVFDFCIKKFDFKTPGRGDDEDDIPESEKSIVLENNDFTEVAKAVLAAVGGKENVEDVDYCVTRLRFSLKDASLVNEKACKAAGAAGVLRPSKNTAQVIIGTKVQFVYDELAKLLK